VAGGGGEASRAGHTLRGETERHFNFAEQGTSQLGCNTAPSQKRMAAKSPSRTPLETADTATKLITFCLATDTIDAAKAGGGLVFDFLRFAFCGAVFARIAFPKGGSGRVAA
jgi:hypothetical protein